MRISDWSSDVCSSDLLTSAELDALNVASVDLLHELRAAFAPRGFPMLVSGCMGPRGDGYDPGRIMSRAEAEDYHSHQAAILSSARPDMLSAFTMNNVNAAIGLPRRTEARCEGEECVSKGRSRWSAYHSQTK